MIQQFKDNPNFYEESKIGQGDDNEEYDELRDRIKPKKQNLKFMLTVSRLLTYNIPNNSDEIYLLILELQEYLSKYIMKFN